MQQLIADASIVFLIGFGSLFIFLILAIFLLISITIMHNILYPRLDSILFRDPYFSSFELTAYSSWPLSFIKTLQFMYLIAYPDFLKRKRFKGLTDELPIGPRIKLASKMYMVVHFVAAFIGVFWILFMILALMIDI